MYPSVQLEDALFVGEGGNVIDSFVGRMQVFQEEKKKGMVQAGQVAKIEPTKPERTIRGELVTCRLF